MSMNVNVDLSMPWTKIRIHRFSKKFMLLVLTTQWRFSETVPMSSITNSFSLRSRYLYSKTCLKQPLRRRPNIGFEDRLLLNAGQKYCRMLQETCIRLPSFFKIFVLLFFEWPLKTGLTVHVS